MKNRFLVLGRCLALAAALCCAGPATWAANVPAGTLITGSVSGAATGLLGLDSGFSAGAGSNITALAAADLEFLTDDYALGIDFATDGLVTVYNNSGARLLAGVYTLSFDFAGLPEAFSSFALADTTGITGGSVSVSRVDGDTLRITLDNASFSDPYGSFSAQIGTAAAAVPEPGSLALAAAALGLLAGGRRRARFAAGRELCA